MPEREEPKVVTEDVRRVLRRVVRGGPDEGDSVSLIAERAETSTRTVYRVLQNTRETITLDLADRLCIAAGSHITDCRLVDSSGQEVEY